MKSMFRAAVPALLAVCALSGAALAQEPVPPVTPSTDFSVESLPLDPIAGLAEPSGPDPVAEAPAAQRYFLLLFDSPLAGVRQMDEVSAAVETWLSEELQAADAAAVVSYYGQELLVAQDFTRDREALKAAVGVAVRGQVAAAETGSGADLPSLLARLPQGADLSRRSASFYGVLQVLAEAVDSVPGPKGMLVFSKGFGRPRFTEMVAGPELGIAPQALAASPALEKYLPESHLFEPTLEALVSRQIRLYPVDLATDYRETFPLAGVMSRLAAETDGRYVYPATELPRLLVEIAQAGAPGALAADAAETRPVPQGTSIEPLRSGRE